ncbi:MAG TPA: choice-of-anchor tandem repeat GloVer-containing protein [Pseudomonadales bacterium]|nr:choice-of-anchor tandem repeat GloVer-containing protein [Pseudomonadales bacterium]
MIKSTGPGVASTNLFGTTYRGGNFYGTIFEISPDGYETNIYDFPSDAEEAHPIGDLILSSNTLYGVTQDGYTNVGVIDGVIFSVNTDGTGYTDLHHFTNSPDGANPQAGLTLSGNTLYGTASAGGNNGYGTVFSINTNGTGYTNLYSFGASGDGQEPRAALLLVSNKLYGTTFAGGTYGGGTIFSINTNGTGYTNLYSFGASGDGQEPLAGLLLISNKLYGTTSAGGAYTLGTIFSFTLGSTTNWILHSFANLPDGANPLAGLTLSGNTLYGTTYNGGIYGLSPAGGTIFRIGVDGTGYTNLMSFGSSDTDYSANPRADLIILGGLLYGTTTYGTFYNSGVVFSVNTNGTGFDDIYDFGTNPNNDGTSPYGGVCSP